MRFNIKKQNNYFHVYFDTDDSEIELPALWLRERSQEPDQVDKQTQQRLYNPHLSAVDLSICAAQIDATQLTLTFSDGHHSQYPKDFLTQQITHFNSGLPAPTPWIATDQLPVHFDWQKLLIDENLFQRSVSEFLRYGYIILSGTDTHKDSLLDIATHYGYLRETNFGRYFEVYSKPQANDLAYTPHAIGPHTDNPYRDPVPGIQLLHCLNNQTHGGYSTLVDSLSVAQTLQNQHPNAYKLLTEVVVRFRFFDVNSELVSFHPLIERDNLGNILGIHYSPRLDDLPLLSPTKTAAFQQARKLLCELLEDPSYEKKFKLASGELMMFDNNRILHGRTAFNPQQGVRHLQGCYIDRDGPKSIYRVANRQPIRSAI
ncbi:MAG: TauD/TfdA family dioxygenase [Oceanospirillaceae bacterium]|nr:TauD/TfdA family dioxygenase [Oceanospirillaceae bacterium]